MGPSGCSFQTRRPPEQRRASADCFVTVHLDLDAYCARVDYDGPRTPTLSTLHAITAAQTRTIGSPAELLDVLAAEFGLMLPPGTVLNCPGLDWATPGNFP